MALYSTIEKNHCLIFPRCVCGPQFCSMKCRQTLLSGILPQTERQSPFCLVLGSLPGLQRILRFWTGIRSIGMNWRFHTWVLHWLGLWKAQSLEELIYFTRERKIYFLVYSVGWHWTNLPNAKNHLGSLFKVQVPWPGPRPTKMESLEWEPENRQAILRNILVGDKLDLWCHFNISVTPLLRFHHLLPEL